PSSTILATHSLHAALPIWISGAHVTQAAAEGDASALRCLEVVGRWLGHGLATMAAILDPACFVIGGGASAAGEMLLGPARAAQRSEEHTSELQSHLKLVCR